MKTRLQVSIFLALVAFAAGPVAAQEQESRHRDNSGRQIAVVVPGMPRPATPTGIAPVPVQRLGVVKTQSGGSSAHPRTHRASTMSSVATPVEVSPEVKAAIQKGTVIAQGFSNVAVKRAGDVVCWVSTMWRQLNDVPQVTPTTEYRAPLPPVGSMRPLEAERDHRLYFTNERRLKTVVAR